MNSDFKELLQLLNVEKVEYLVVGAYAVMHHTQPRFTKDLDIWLRPTPENADKIVRVFQLFGMPFVDVTKDDFANEGLQYAVGHPPTMFDFLTSLPALDFQTSWENKAVGNEAGFKVYFLSQEDLIKAKTLAARPQDLADIEELKRAE